MSGRWWRVCVTLLLAILMLLPGPGGAARAAQVIHVVQPDETLESIARRYGVDPSTLAQRNNLASPYALEVGQTLLVAGSSAGSVPESRPPALPQAAPAARLAGGLSLSPAPVQILRSIAWQYGTGSDLRRWAAPLASLVPRPGSTLLIPVRAPGAEAPARQSCIEWPAAGEALVARVNSWGIGLAAFERRWGEITGGLRHAGVNTWDAEFRAIEPQARRSVVNEMIDHVLVQQWAAGTGTTVGAAELDAWLQARIQDAGGRDALSAWLADTGQTWEGYQQQGCHAILREALVRRLTRGSPDPEVSAEALGRWLVQRRSSSSIELYPLVAGAAGNGLPAAGLSDTRGTLQAP